ncbi:MAG: LD-carboxypeptidase [Bacteroidales bacterium]|jgi:muramoyltetrapeptide carboxypeptidase|nr:LD-carboxypeptidase [Bacteroidales bacterium]
MTTFPTFLQSGDIVAIVSPSGPIDVSYIDKGKEILESWGLQVWTAPHVCARHGVFAGTDEERSADMQAALNSQEIRAIFCSRGGYGAIRIVEQLDYTAFLQNPKWIIGFSDITVFHSKINTLSVASIHGAMPKNFETIHAESLQSLRNAIFGTRKNIEWQANNCNKLGCAQGRLVGGNLSVLYSIRGLSLEYDYRNAILFIEDLNEYVYHIDRMLQNLKLAGILSQLAGLIVGGMTNMKQGVDTYGMSIEQLITDTCKEYDFPIAFDFPSGHGAENEAFVIGQSYSLRIDKDKAKLSVKEDIFLTHA